MTSEKRSRRCVAIEPDTETVHRLPRTHVVDRIRFLKSISRGKRVIHIGFWGTEGIRHRGTWLHAELQGVARELVGIDINVDAVTEARREGYEAYAADSCNRDAIAGLHLRPGEVLVAGEVIEHLEAPGAFLDAVHILTAQSSLLVITTPNAYSLTNLLSALFYRELINPDHVALYSWYTLSNIARRHGWQSIWFAGYRYPNARTTLGKVAFGLQSLASRVSPFVGHGLIGVFRKLPTYPEEDQA